MKIVFFGEDSFSCVVLQSLIDAKFNILLVVSPFYQNNIHVRLQKTTEKNGIEYLRQPNLTSNEFISKIASLNPDFIVVTHFEKLLCEELINIPLKGAINLHPSLLPDYRGMAPQHWPIINGDKETGITIHFIDKTADTGAIILQKKIKINYNDYVTDLQKKFLNVYKNIMVDALKLITHGNYTPIKQSHLSGRYYGKLKKSQCQIDLNLNAQITYNLVRGVSMPYYGAFIKDHIIWRAHIATKEETQKLLNTYTNVGIYLETENGSFILFNDTVLIIDKYEKKQQI